MLTRADTTCPGVLDLCRDRGRAWTGGCVAALFRVRTGTAARAGGPSPRSSARGSSPSRPRTPTRPGRSRRTRGPSCRRGCRPTRWWRVRCAARSTPAARGSRSAVGAAVQVARAAGGGVTGGHGARVGPTCSTPCSARSVGPLSPGDLRGWTGFAGWLAPTDAELAARADALVALLAVPSRVTVGWAQAALARVPVGRSGAARRERPSSSRGRRRAWSGRSCGSSRAGTRGAGSRATTCRAGARRQPRPGAPRSGAGDGDAPAGRAAEGHRPRARSDRQRRDASRLGERVARELGLSSGRHRPSPPCGRPRPPVPVDLPSRAPSIPSVTSTSWSSSSSGSPSGRTRPGGPRTRLRRPGAPAARERTCPRRRSTRTPRPDVPGRTGRAGP